jgi:hypothetical protein
MIRYRALVCIALAAVAGTLLNTHYGVSGRDPVLVLIREQKPDTWLALWWCWTAMLYTTPYFLLSMVMSTGAAMSLRLPRFGVRAGKLPRLVPVEERKELEVVLGEIHHQQREGPAEHPEWLTIPERGLHTGIMALGAVGSGKTSSVMYPVASQVLGWAAGDERRKTAALVLEVKGDFCHHVKGILEECGRGKDYAALSMDGEWRYNPLHNDRTPSASAYAIATLMNQLFGKGKDPFWQTAYTHLISNVIRLYRTVDDYVTLLDVYHACCDKNRLHAKLEDAHSKFAAKSILLSMNDYLSIPGGVIDHLKWEDDPSAPGMLKLPWSESTEEFLAEKEIAYSLAEVQNKFAADPVRRAELKAVTEWYLGEWSQCDAKLKTSIIAGIAPFLAVFNTDQRARYVFCPPKEAYDPIANADGRYGKVLPPLRQLIESGMVLALDFQVAEDPGLARLIGVLLKQDFQRAMLLRIPQIAKEQWRTWRSVLFLCDEYHEFATCAGSDPSGDEKFFALSRSAKCIPLVATQSLASLKSTLPDHADWPTLVQQFRTTLILTVKDEATAKWASDMCGREDRTKVQYSLSESGNDARVSMLTGRPVSGKSSLSASKSYSVQKDVRFEPRVFTELGNSQAIALAFDGVNTIPATRLYLRPYWWTDEQSYFEHVRKGDL